MEFIEYAYFYSKCDLGMLSAAASQGLILRWDIDSGLSQCDKFLYVSDEYIKVGYSMRHVQPK